MYQDDFSDIDALVARLQGPQPSNPTSHVPARVPDAVSLMPPGMREDLAGFAQIINAGGGREGALRQAQRLKNKWGDRIEAGIGTDGWAYVKPNVKPYAGPTLSQVVRRPPTPAERKALASTPGLPWNARAAEPTQGDWDRWAEEGARQRRGQFARDVFGWGSPASPWDETGMLRTGADWEQARQAQMRESAARSKQRAEAEAQRRATANAAFNSANASMPPGMHIFGGIPLPGWVTEPLADIAGNVLASTGGVVAGAAEKSPLSPFSYIPVVHDVLQKTLKPAGQSMMRTGGEISTVAGLPEGFAKDVFSAAGGSVPLLASGGNPLLGAVLAYDQAKGEGQSEGEAIKEGALTGATFGLMKGASPFLERLFPGTGFARRAARFGARAVSNTAIPVAVEAPVRLLEGKSAVDPRQLASAGAFGTLFAAMQEAGAGKSPPSRSLGENRVGSAPEPVKYPRVPAAAEEQVEPDPAQGALAGDNSANLFAGNFPSSNTAPTAPRGLMRTMLDGIASRRGSGNRPPGEYPRRFGERPYPRLSEYPYADTPTETDYRAGEPTSALQPQRPSEYRIARPEGQVGLEFEPYGSKNVFVGTQEAEAAWKRIKERKRIERGSGGPSTEELADWLTLAAYHVEAGARAFPEFSQRLIANIGERVRPHLEDLFRQATAMPGGGPIREGGPGRGLVGEEVAGKRGEKSTEPSVEGFGFTTSLESDLPVTETPPTSSGVRARSGTVFQEVQPGELAENGASASTPVAKRPVRGILKEIAEGKVYARRTGGRHHLFPVALGNTIRYGHNSLTLLSAWQHTILQGELEAHLRSVTKQLAGGKVVDMWPRKGNSGEAVRRSFTVAERTKAVDDFYQKFAEGRYYPAFQMELKAARKKGLSK